MTNVNDNWARLESVVEWTGMTINGFARHIGLSRAENLYQIKSGKNGISRNLTKRIVSVFPEISAGWLLTGEGSMLSTAVDGSREIPFYEGDNVWQNLLNLHNSQPSSYMSIPAVGVCDCAVRCNDEAMAKDILPGTIVFLKRIDPKLIIPGSVCVVVGESFVLLRRARFVRPQAANAPREILRLEPANKCFDVMDISLERVIDAYSVVGSLKLF